MRLPLGVKSSVLERLYVINPFLVYLVDKERKSNLKKVKAREMIKATEMNGVPQR
jgi:hypothetical protein